MTAQERIRGRNIGVIGMARSGLAAAFLLDRMGGRPFVSDSKPEAKLTEPVARLRAAAIPFETSGHTSRLLGCDFLVISPGVPLSIPIVAEAREKGIPIFSEIEVASWVCRGRIIGITGSNGKTTTTTLIGEILKAGGLETWVGGNIGFPFSEFADRVEKHAVAVIEVSNFQLETIEDFAPHTALILNITPDHLDRHGTFAEYKRAKLRITENQAASDLLVLNENDPELDPRTLVTDARVGSFSDGASARALAFVRDNLLHARTPDGKEVRIIGVTEIGIKGPHNLQNAAAAVVAAVRYGVKPEVIAEVLRTFAGVEHRLEEVGRIAGIRFVNDSKATNVDSVVYALRSIETPIYLIAGGRDKGGDFSQFIRVGMDKIKAVLAIGEARGLIFDALGQRFPVIMAESLEDAVQKAFDMARPGETVLLSPGCASFDMFDNFEHRGKVFKAAVAGLKNGKSSNETVAHG